MFRRSWSRSENDPSAKASQCACKGFAMHMVTLERYCYYELLSEK